MDKTKALNDDELKNISGGFVLTREQYESGNYDLEGNSEIEFEDKIYRLVAGYTDVPLYYLYKEVGGSGQLLIPLGKL